MQQRDYESRIEKRRPVYGSIRQTETSKQRGALAYCRTDLLPRPRVSFEVLVAHRMKRRTVIWVPSFPADGFGSELEPDLAGINTPSE